MMRGGAISPFVGKGEGVWGGGSPVRVRASSLAAVFIEGKGQRRAGRQAGMVVP